MTKSLTKKMRHEVEDALDDAVKALKRAADDLGDDAEKAVGEAAVALRHAAESLVARTAEPLRHMAEQVPPEAKKLADKAVQEAKEHPLATTVAALSAAAALIQILSAGRRRKAA